MIELNIKFLDQYKRIDKICRDMFDNQEGVSIYIKKMEETPYSKQNKVHYWDDFYKELKHSRWMRNQLAHNQPLDSDFCTEDDIDWLNDFYSDLLNCNDPLAIAYKEEKEQDIKYKSEEYYTYIDVEKNKAGLSLLERIVNKIKSWFK